MRELVLDHLRFLVQLFSQNSARHCPKPMTCNFSLDDPSGAMQRSQQPHSSAFSGLFQETHIAYLQ